MVTPRTLEIREDTGGAGPSGRLTDTEVFTLIDQITVIHGLAQLAHGVQSAETLQIYNRVILQATQTATQVILSHKSASPSLAA